MAEQLDDRIGRINGVIVISADIRRSHHPGCARKTSDGPLYTAQINGLPTFPVLPDLSEYLAERIRLTLDSVRRAIEAGTVERAYSGEQAEARQAAIDGQLATLAAVDARLDAIRAQAATL